MIGTMSLVPQVVDAVSLPVVAQEASWTDEASCEYDARRPRCSNGYGVLNYDESARMIY